MNYRKMILVLGLAAIAMVCFFPPKRTVNVQVGYSLLLDSPNYENQEQTDYYKLATWVTGIVALTGAAFFFVGPRRRIVDAGSGEVVAR